MEDMDQALKLLRDDYNTSWHARLQNRFVLHPTVQLMTTLFPLKDVTQPALEFPHVSETDATRLAYTRIPADGANDRQLVTSIGKYLARHWADVGDHHRRDVPGSGRAGGSCS